MHSRSTFQNNKRGYSCINKSSFPQSSMQRSKLQDTQKQKVIQDQHYSNNIMMTALSTMESLEAAQDNSSLKRENKIYGHYDKVRFDDKNFSELKSQLQTQLTLLKASRQVFQMENPKINYTFSNQFNENQVLNQIQKYKQSFKDKDVQKMCNDFGKIVRGETQSAMSFEQQSYKVKYPENQSSKYRKDIVKRGIKAADQMDREEEKIKSLYIKEQSELPIQINYSAIQYRQPYKPAIYGNSRRPY